VYTFVHDFKSGSKESYLIAIKRNFRHLAGIMDIGLWYPKDEDFNLISYLYTDYAGYKVDRKKYFTVLPTSWEFSNLMARKEIRFNGSINY